MNNKQAVGVAALIGGLVITAIVVVFGDGGFGEAIRDILSPQAGGDWDMLQLAKNMDIWFMLMMVAFLMIFIRKFEWGVCLAVLLSAATSYIFYLGIQQFYFGQGWDQTLMIRAVICSITVVIAIGVFLGTCKMWQYLLVGAAFQFVYCLIEWLIGGGLNDLIGQKVIDDGGSILVHMCAAYFGLGVALGIRDKRAYDEPMYTTTHSVTFVWLSSMLLWILWPSFVTSLIPADSPADVTWATMTCYMSGIGSIISTYAVCMILQTKVNPLVYTYAMLGGPVAIGAPLLQVGPWFALFLGLVAGAVSAICFIYLQPVFTKKIGTMDVMGVHNLHGICGWIGVIAVCAVTATFGSLIMAAITVVITIVTGLVIGLVVKQTRGDMPEICTDDPDFIKNEAPQE